MPIKNRIDSAAFGEVESVYLEHCLFYFTQITTAKGLDHVNLEIDAVAEAAMDALTMQIYGFVYGQDMDKKEKISHPQDWWEAFKERWFPKWALRRWPVRETHHTITFRETYPDFKQVLPPNQYGQAVIKLWHQSWDDSDDD